MAACTIYDLVDGYKWAPSMTALMDAQRVGNIYGRLHHQRPRRWMQVGAINDRIDGRTEGGEGNKDTSSIVHEYLCFSAGLPVPILPQKPV